MLLAGAVLAGVGYVFGYAELVVLGVVALAAFAGALVFAGWPPSLAVRRTIEPDRVVRGDSGRAILAIRSTARWRSQVLVGHDRVTTVDAARSGAGAVREAAIPLLRLKAGAHTDTEYPLPTLRRGVLDIGPLSVARRDPLGLVAATRQYGGVTRLWVHPRAHPLRSVPVGASRSLDGVVDAVQYGSITFHALREYVPGDDLRHVHWRTSAHIGQLMVREHVDTSLPRIVVFVDDRAAAYRGSLVEDALEEVIEAATSVVVAARRAELHVELHLVSGRVLTPPDGHVEVRSYLDLLAEVQPVDEPSLRPAVYKLRQRGRGDTLVLLTGSSQGSDLEPVGLLRDVYPTVVIGVLGAMPEGLASLPKVIMLPARNAEEFAKQWDGVNRW